MDVTPLFNRLLAQHRPVAVADPFADKQLLVHCAACDGPRWHTWRAGDDPIVCELWAEAIALGAVIADTEPAPAATAPTKES
jgi:hypothetical protein